MLFFPGMARWRSPALPPTYICRHPETTLSFVFRSIISAQG